MTVRSRQRNASGLPIGDYLYSRRASNSPKRQESFIPSAVNEESERLLHKLKVERYADIFNQLSPDLKGCIDAHTIVVEDLEAPLLAAIAPLLQEIEEAEHSLNFAEFCSAMDELLKRLNPVEKHALLRPRRRRDELSSELSFHPTINEYASERLEVRQSKPIHERLLADYLVNCTQTVQKKLETIKHRREQDEMNSCTFKPAILEYAAPDAELVEIS
jgi:hypothetical protein